MIGEQVGNFRLVAQIGKGGMGEVYLAEHAGVGTRVAIKMLLPHVSANEDLVRRFFNEAIAVGQIQHAGIGKIFDSGTHAGRAYLVMEFLPGETLAARLRHVGRLPLATAGELGKQISGVLEAVHRAGITHRDLKPDNIFIVPDDELGERIKIVDFGIAKLSGLGGGMTATTASALGTPAYMSPEQWRNAKHVDWRADAYSLGCLAFEMIAGMPPFIAETIGEACAKHLTEDPPALSSIVDVPPDVDLLIARLLAKDPDQRPAAMRDIATMFEGIAATTSHELTAMQAAAPGPLPFAGLGATQVTRVPPIPQATTLRGASGQLQASPKPRAATWIAIGLGIALAAALVLLVVVMTRPDAEQSAIAMPELANDKPAPRLPKPIVVDPPPTQGSGHQPAIVEVPRPLPEPELPVPPRAQARTTLSIVTKPTGVMIKFDGAELGTSPLVKAIPAGRHTITATALGKTRTEVVFVKSGEAISRRWVFDEPAPTGRRDSLSPGFIQARVFDNVSGMRACAATPNEPARLVRIEVKIAPSGSIELARDLQRPPTRLSECYRALVLATAFPPSEHGGFGQIVFNPASAVRK